MGVCTVHKLNRHLLYKFLIQNITDISSLSKALHKYQTLLHKDIPLNCDPPTSPFSRLSSMWPESSYAYCFLKWGMCYYVSTENTQTHTQRRNLDTLCWNTSDNIQEGYKGRMKGFLRRGCGWGETCFTEKVWWGEFSGPATGLTLNFPFLSVNFLFFIFYNLATVTTAQKRNCEKSLLKRHSGCQPNPAVHH